MEGEVGEPGCCPSGGRFECAAVGEGGSKRKVADAGAAVLSGEGGLVSGELAPGFFGHAADLDRHSVFNGGLGD